jgi:hypothetical protein
MVGSEGLKSHFRKLGWKVDMTIQSALEAFDDYREQIENTILKREEGK